MDKVYTKKLKILNLSPDSFSDGSTQVLETAYSFNKFQKLIGEGPDFIDIGAESTRPNASSISTEEELSRLEPFLAKISLQSLNLKGKFSLDSRNPATVAKIFKNYSDNFSFLNDVSGLQNPELIKTITEYINPSVKLIAMHSCGGIPALRSAEVPDSYYDSAGGLLEEMKRFFHFGIKLAETYGINSSRIILDPGLGFGKNLQHSLEIIEIVPRLKEEFGLEILIGASRKSFLRLWKNKPDASIAELDEWTGEYQNLFQDQVDYFRIH